LVEREIAQQLGISRMPVREAIQQLVDEGLAVKEHHKGASVHPYSPQELEEIYSLRVVLEHFVMERVMRFWTPEGKAALEKIARSMAEPAKSGDIHRLYELDNHFHEVLWRMAHHTMLLEAVSGLRARINRFLIEAAQSLSKEDALAYEAMHLRIVAEIDSGKVRRAKAAISEHVMIAKNRIMQHYRYLDQPELQHYEKQEYD
jgi:DNA-binding GntR family transcriptional regulator